MAMNEHTHNPADVVTGLMLQITQYAERLALLDQRETRTSPRINRRLDELARPLTETVERADAVNNLGGNGSPPENPRRPRPAGCCTCRALTDMTAGNSSEGDQAYKPAPAPRWWNLDGTERDEALNRMRAWVEQIFRPGYGHLAASLGPCWDQHPLCLYGLDWLMEL